MSETEYAGHLKILISGQNPHVRTYSGSQKRTRNLHSTHSFTKERLRNRFCSLALIIFIRRTDSKCGTLQPIIGNGKL